MKTIAQQLNVKDFPFIIRDKNNNELYYEDSNGYWEKREYENNNQVYFKNSNDQWVKREYDENGNQLYYENSGGKIIDKRSPMTKEEAEKKINIKIK